MMTINQDDYDCASILYRVVLEGVVVPIGNIACLSCNGHPCPTKASQKRPITSPQLVALILIW